jgi:hypothetical protein
MEIRIRKKTMYNAKLLLKRYQISPCVDVVAKDIARYNNAVITKVRAIADRCGLGETANEADTSNGETNKTPKNTTASAAAHVGVLALTGARSKLMADQKARRQAGIARARAARIADVARKKKRADNAVRVLFSQANSTNADAIVEESRKNKRSPAVPKPVMQLWLQKHRSELYQHAPAIDAALTQGTKVGEVRSAFLVAYNTFTE